MLSRYTSEEEAAALAKIPLTDFPAFARQHGLAPVAWGPAILYRLADIEEAIDRAWRESIKGDGRGISIGSKAAGVRGAASVPLPRRRRTGRRSPRLLRPARQDMHPELTKAA